MWTKHSLYPTGDKKPNIYQKGVTIENHCHSRALELAPLKREWKSDWLLCSTWPCSTSLSQQSIRIGSSEKRMEVRLTRMIRRQSCKTNSGMDSPSWEKDRQGNCSWPTSNCTTAKESIKGLTAFGSPFLVPKNCFGRLLLWEGFNGHIWGTFNLHDFSQNLKLF